MTNIDRKQASVEGFGISPLENERTIQIVLFWISVLTLGGLTGLLLMYFLGSMKRELIVTSLSFILTATALELNRRGKVQLSAGLIAAVMILMVTILATIGQGIHDIGIIAYPSILIVASLLVDRKMVISLSTLTICCAGWLIYGEFYGLFHSIPPRINPTFNFIVVSGILVITAIMTQLLAITLQNSIHLRGLELAQRLRVEKALREAEEMYRTLVEKTSVVTYRDTADINAHSLYISPQIQKMTGYTQSQWLSTPTFWKSLVHPEDLPGVLKDVEKCITTGEKTVSEYRIFTKDRRWVWVRDEAIAIKDSKGELQNVHGVYVDITEQKLAELAIHKRETILAAVAETAQLLLRSQDWRNDINQILGLLGRATSASHAYIFENHTGSDGVMLSSQKYEWCAPGMVSELKNPNYQDAPLIPAPELEDWYHKLSAGKYFYGSKQQFPEFWKQVFEPSGLKTLLDMPILVNGEWWGIIGFDDFENEMPWSQAEIDALVATAGNIGTAMSRQHTNEALRASEEKFQRAFHHTIVPMIISRVSDQMTIDVNEAFIKKVGYSRNEIIGFKGAELNIWANQHERDRMLKILENAGYVDEFKAGFRLKNGDLKTGLISVVHIQIAGEPCFLFTLIDISEIDHLLKELKAKNEELEKFTYTVSHDLKAPLVTISGFLGYLGIDAKKGNIERVTKDIERINEAVSKMQRLLAELLELSRIGRITNPPETVPFAEIVAEALKLVEGRLLVSQVRVEVEADLPSIYGDRLRLIEVMQNLIDNAAKFSSKVEAPCIEIGADRQNGSLAFYVKDNGIGIAPEYHDRVFGLFNKLDNSTEGTGIGLTLVKRIVEVHGGRIWVKSEPGKGTTFYFTLADKPQ
ncbi:MAG TPA: PAS domain S-box protein [Anaerolineales bacterium]|nr:PAS domain S-box protein [Anaerolineales bacterium]